MKMKMMKHEFTDEAIEVWRWWKLMHEDWWRWWSMMKMMIDLLKMMSKMHEDLYEDCQIRWRWWRWRWRWSMKMKIKPWSGPWRWCHLMKMMMPDDNRWQMMKQWVKMMKMIPTTDEDSMNPDRLTEMTLPPPRWWRWRLMMFCWRGSRWWRWLYDEVPDRSRWWTWPDDAKMPWRSEMKMQELP